MEIKITIENKHCTVQGTPVIVCGNSDYTVAFDFDAEWELAGEKTARFSYVRDGARMYQDAPITGSTAEMPAVYRTREVQVGVYAGDLVTSTPARIPCEKSIICDTCTPDDPIPVYREGGALNDEVVSAEYSWSSKNTVDKLCPSFAESGSVVTCEPLEDYPLEVVSELDDIGKMWQEITLTQCGKNLFDFQQGTYQVNYTTGIRYGYALKMPPGTYTLYAKQIGEGSHFVYGRHHGADGSYKADIRLVQDTQFYTRTVTVETGDVLYIYDGISSHGEVSANAMFANFQVQIEAGSVKTDYEPYNGVTFTVDLSNLDDPMYFGSYNWNTGVLDTGDNGYYQHNPEDGSFTRIDITSYVPSVVRNILALPGANCLYSDCGDTAVKGKSDPVKIIEKLTNAILTLGDNV